MRHRNEIPGSDFYCRRQEQPTPALVTPTRSSVAVPSDLIRGDMLEKRCRDRAADARICRAAPKRFSGRVRWRFFASGHGRKARQRRRGMVPG